MHESMIVHKRGRKGGYMRCRIRRLLNVQMYRLLA